MGLLNRIEELEKELLELKELVKEENEFPQDGDEYWFMDINGDVASGKWENFDIEKDMLEIDNVFGDKEQAKLAVEKLKVEAELRKFSRPFDEDDNNYFIELSMFDKTLTIDDDECWQIQGTIYFESMEIANEAIDTVGADRIKKYLFGVEEQ